MSRAERLLGLIDELRSRRRPVSGDVLAQAMGVSLRTLYRDIASLRAQGAPIEGEPGLGYVLRPGFLLPPLMFGDEEVAALALGASWVAERADAKLAAAARSALARIGDVLPRRLSDRLEWQHLIVGPAERADQTVDLSLFRRAIRAERKLRIGYRDADGQTTERIIWPFQIGFFERARLLSAWCEMRDGVRHFRTDRIVDAEELEERYPRRRHDLVKVWRELEGLTDERP